MKGNNNWKLDRAKEIVKSIYIGVEDENNEIREFNILDYYRIINISPSALYEGTISDLKGEFSESELKKFHSFVLKSLNDLRLTIKAIMEVKHSVIVNGELREITDFEKTNVIRYIKSNKLPLTADVYALVLKDYLAGRLDLEHVNEEIKTLVK